MNIREIATSRLREYENNPRNNDLAVEKVRYSIERFGFLVPVIVDMNYVIVAGHTRVRACRELGIQSVPCIIADELTEEQINFFQKFSGNTAACRGGSMGRWRAIAMRMRKRSCFFWVPLMTPH